MISEYMSIILKRTSIPIQKTTRKLLKKFVVLKEFESYDQAILYLLKENKIFLE